MWLITIYIFFLLGIRAIVNLWSRNKFIIIIIIVIVIVIIIIIIIIIKCFGIVLTSFITLFSSGNRVDIEFLFPCFPCLLFFLVLSVYWSFE